MNTKRILFLLLNIVLIVGVVFANNVYITNTIENKKVFTYKNDLAIGSVVTMKDLAVIEVPAKSFIDLVPRSSDEVVGKVLSSNVNKGQFVYTAQLKDPSGVDAFHQIDLSKYRKFALEVNALTSLGNELRRGDTVDLVYTGVTEDAGGGTSDKEVLYSKTFIQNALVYEVYDKYGNPMVSEEKQAELFQNGDVQEPGILVLALPLEQVEELTARLNLGVVSVVGRFDESASYGTLGYVIGGSAKVFSGNVSVETDATKFIDLKPVNKVKSEPVKNTETEEPKAE